MLRAGLFKSWLGLCLLLPWGGVLAADKCWLWRTADLRWSRDWRGRLWLYLWLPLWLSLRLRGWFGLAAPAVVGINRLRSGCRGSGRTGCCKDRGIGDRRYARL